jgi:hypothetical protein
LLSISCCCDIAIIAIIGTFPISRKLRWLHGWLVRRIFCLFRFSSLPYGFVSSASRPYSVYHPPTRPPPSTDLAGGQIASSSSYTALIEYTLQTPYLFMDLLRHCLIAIRQYA